MGEADLDALFEGVFLSRDPADVARWSADALRHRLYLADGMARGIFAGESSRKAHAMAYVPGVAWALYHDPGMWSFFTRRDMRRRGIARRLWGMTPGPPPCPPGNDR